MRRRLRGFEKSYASTSPYHPVHAFTGGVLRGDFGNSYITSPDHSGHPGRSQTLFCRLGECARSGPGHHAGCAERSKSRRLVRSLALASPTSASPSGTGSANLILIFRGDAAVDAPSDTVESSTSYSRLRWDYRVDRVFSRASRDPRCSMY